MATAAEIDCTFTNFFGVVSASLRDSGDISKTCVELETAKSLDDVKLKGLLDIQRWSECDVQFHDKTVSTQTQVCYVSDRFLHFF